jgi:hypothetical protein
VACNREGERYNSRTTARDSKLETLLSLILDIGLRA